MTILLVILIILASVVLGLIVLVQNPKGGGLTGSIAGLSNQFMGVKQTTDVLEKGTWIFAGLIGLLCLLSVAFISKSGTANVGVDGKNLPMPAQQTTPAAPTQGAGGTMNLNPQPAPAPAPAQPK
jgi:preprotein translocase subunit SecG